MARMIPARIYSGNPSLGEKEIFKRLSDDPLTADWIVLHSLDIADHIRRVSGEADFIVIVPSMGVLCIEVKASSRIRREGGQWFYGNNPQADQRGPFRQASEAMHSVRKRLIAKHSELNNVPFWSAVIFPYVEFQIESGEWHSWQVIDTNRFKRKSIGVLIKSILTKARKHLTENRTLWFSESQKEPTKTQCERIATALRPDFEVFEAPRNRVERLSEDVKKYTTEQFAALNAMSSNPRVIFTGPAGTGKTLLAMEAARRSIADGNRVLFICYNRLLGKRLESDMEPLQPRLTVGTLHKHMLNVSGMSLQNQSTSSAFWNDELPRLAIDELLEDSSEGNIFDEVIIDEAQDLLRTTYLDFIDLSLRGGVSAGKWKIFGDFERQAIFSSNSDLEFEAVATDRLNNAPRYTLRVNCRNTPRIASFVNLLGNLVPEYSRILRPDDGVEPKILYFHDQEDQRQKLVETIQSLKDDGFTNTDIVVLAPISERDAVAYSIMDGNIKFTSFDTASRKRIGAGTIHSYKGMESPAVIVTDIAEITGEQAKSLFYVAITRALHRLYILASNNIRQDVLRITLGS
jgi:DNA polymerase III delta prime subunit